MGGKRKGISLIPVDTPIEEAQEIRRTKDSRDYRQAVLTAKEFKGIVMPDRKFVIRDLIAEESMTIINGYRGLGKSMFIMALANEVTWGGRVGPWKVERATNAMIVDGEMPFRLLQERLKRMDGEREERNRPGELFIYPESYAYRVGLKRGNILDPIWRERLSDTVKDLAVEFLVLDNLSSLAPGIDENDKMPFDPVNRWLLELRFNGVALSATHHTGKTGEQRGTSAHEDHMDTSLLLTRPRGYKAEDGCKFVVEAIKDRDFILQGARTTLELVERGNGMLEFAASLTKREVISLNPLMTLEEAEARGISRRTFFRGKSGK